MLESRWVQIESPSLGIVGTGSFLPDRIETNQELARRLSISAGTIGHVTGFQGRRIADPQDATSDLALRAARQALENARLAPEQLDFILLATSVPDEPGVPSACHVQRELGATSAAAFDIGAACAGFVHGLRVAQGLLMSDPTRRYALVIGSDVLCRFASPSDQESSAIFGSGAGAVVLGPLPSGYGILRSVLGSNGHEADFVTIPVGGTRRPATVELVEQRQHFISLKRQHAEQLIERTVSAAFAGILDDAGLTLDDVSLIIFHHATIKVLHSLRAHLGVPEGKVYISDTDHGNIGAGSVPRALDVANRHGRLKDGDLVLLGAMGAGMAWSCALVRWRDPSGSGPRS